MNHLSLFSGIGGFDLAALWEEIETVAQVENDEWCLRVLEKNFPNAKRFTDIRKFNGKPYRDKIDILTGGFPCQPFSFAGKRKGKKDLRFLWPEMLRVIREIRPRFVVGENVPGIIGMALDKVLSDLEALGYTTETFVIPACAKNAPHRRDRVWVVAYSNSTGRKKQYASSFSEKKRKHSGVSTPRRADWTDKSRLGRISHGVSRRVDRIKGLGNAIVPQIAAEIFGFLKQFAKQKETTGLGRIEINEMVQEALTENHEDFVWEVQRDITAKTTRNKLYYERLARSRGILDQNLVKELTELAITREARKIAHTPELSIAAKFDAIVELYESQVNLSHRTSQSVLLQQYSTPAPISYLAGVFAGAYSSVSVFEPCAGNGLLTIAARPEYTTVNEIDTVRLRHLKSQGYKRVLSQDAGQSFDGLEKKFESVLTNPPFGKLDEAVNFGTFGIKTLEHMMVIHALNCMQENGRASVIVGGHANYDDKGRIRKGSNRIFLNYLYQHYNVVDVININGKKLYSRQGTGFDVRMILIDGRKKEAEGHAPLYDARREKPLTDFKDLYERVALAHLNTAKGYEMEPDEYVEVRKQIDSLVPPRIGDWTERIVKYREEHRKLIEERYNEGYYIEARVQKYYPEILPTMKPEHENIDFNAEELLRLQEESKRKRKPLTGLQGKEELYLMRFIDDDSGAEYEAWVPSFSLQQAQRFAQNLAVNLKKNLRHEFSVQWVRPWVEKHQLNGPLGSPYLPTSEGCIVLDTVVPDSMSFETHEALRQVKEAVGDDIDEFVRNRLGYSSKLELCGALAAEQIDAVALAIYNIEARKIGPHGQGMVIGDQTGIGKGRIAAAMIRYGVKRGHKPIFLTEKPNLFTDIYRDLKAIGSAHLVPFIINAKDVKSNVLDEYGDKMYSALDPKEQDAIFQQGILPSVYDFVMATYTQFNSPKKPKKRDFLLALAENNIMILDEAHNASGKGNTGQFLQQVVASTDGVLFLSATFAKRPDNMPLYAMKTVLQESNMDKDELVLAITRGGVALQEIIASELVKEGQMLRRERSSEGVEVNYITLFEKEQEHREIADAITDILRDIIQFQNDYIITRVAEIDDEISGGQQQAQLREGTQRAGADAMPYFSKVFQVINQMLFSIKAESVADRAILRLKEGKKPVIAFSSTMGAFVEDVENIEGGHAREGDIINADFSEVLRRGLKGINRYSIVDVDGQHTRAEIDIASLGAAAQLAYQLITNKIERISTGITISPIDLIVQRIREAGYTVAEVTGRKYELELFEETNLRGLGELQPEKKDPFPVNIQSMIKSSGRFGPGKQLLGRIKLRKRMVTNEAFRRFNNNEIDVLLINQSGSTGASAHAIPTDKVPASEVKQRAMIILQAELDISTEVQKRGRINRTGQIFKPIYDYVTSAIPAEQRLMMMLQSKLKSLDANTTSNQKQSKKILDVADFLNKYGDVLVAEYLEENPEIDAQLDHPLDTENYSVDEPALKVSGRVAVLPTKDQQEFYDDMTSRYNDYVEFLKQSGEYDLEVERLELKAKLIGEEPVIMGKGGSSTFGTDSILEEVEVDVLKKPLTVAELHDAINQATGGRSPQDIQFSILDKYEQTESKHIKEIAAIEQYYDEAIRNLPEEKALKKILETEGEQAYKERLEKDTKKFVRVREEKIKKIFEKQADIKNYLTRIFKFFYIGQPVTYVQRYDDKGEKTEEFPAVFIGFTIDHRKKNPYAFSNIKLRFAVASGIRLISLPASSRVDINLILGASNSSGYSGIDLSEYWNKAISQKMKSREIRHIVTGNILQGLGRFSTGRLISYTTANGSEKKGIFLPMNWEDSESETGRQYTVPATKVFPIIRSLAEGHEMVIGKNISIFRVGGRFKLMVPASRSGGGDVYLNENILALVDGNNFNKVSNEMVAIFDNDRLERMLYVLENEVGTSVTVSRMQYKYIKEKFPEALRVNNFPKLEMLPEEAEPVTPDDDALLLEAEALILLQELELSVRRKRLKQQ